MVVSTVFPRDADRIVTYEELRIAQQCQLNLKVATLVIPMTERSMSPKMTSLIKDSNNLILEINLNEGLSFERLPFFWIN